MPDGTAPAEETSLLFNRDTAWDLIKVSVKSDGSFRFSGLAPEAYEIQISSSHYELEADKLDSLIWTEKSIKRLIDKSTSDFVLPLRLVTQDSPELAPNGSQALNGRVLTAGGEGLAGIRVNASGSVDSLGKGLGNGASPWTTTLKDGYFNLVELPDMRVWLKLYRPDEDGMRFWYLGMLQPQMGTKDVNIVLGPETSYTLRKLSGSIK